jgi:hypothetical protein
MPSSDRKVRFRICIDGSPPVDCATTTAAETDVWDPFAGTYDGSTLCVYISGALENTQAKTGNRVSTPRSRSKSAPMP